MKRYLCFLLGGFTESAIGNLIVATIEMMIGNTKKSEHMHKSLVFENEKEKMTEKDVAKVTS